MAATSKEMETIATERKHAQFSVRGMTHLLDGGEEKTRLREEAYLYVERDPVLNESGAFNHTEEEQRRATMAKCKRLLEIFPTLREPFRKEFINVSMHYDPSLNMRLGVHYSLFMETLRNLSTDKQFEQVRPMVESGQMLGCFAMTELGHSSHLPGLETTATYHAETEEFIIQSPTITSTKWWIGMAGETATHTAALCRTTVNGADAGVLWFLVPLRCPNTGEPLPGVAVGNVGAKMGRIGVDNGWIQFSHVRVPKSALLGRFVQWTPEGKLVPRGSAAVAYSTLVSERVGLASSAVDFIKRGVTIATRYGAVRRQGPNDEQLLYYQSHQRRLMPMIAQCYAMHFACRDLSARYQYMVELMHNDEKEYTKHVAEMHSYSAGMKTWLTWWAMESLELCRQTMGGHGYSLYSMIPTLMGDWAVLTTGGGDNVVLAQQTTKVLLGALQKLAKGVPATGSMSYLNNLTSLKKPSINNFTSMQYQLHMHQALAVSLLTKVARILQQAVAEGTSFNEAWNDNMMVIVNVSRAHVHSIILGGFVQAVQATADASLKTALTELCELYALSSMETLMADFLETGSLLPADADAVRKLTNAACKRCRADAVPLVDAFNIPDFALRSPLGRYDGDIYPKYLELVKSRPRAMGVPKYFNELIRPLTKSKL